MDARATPPRVAVLVFATTLIATIQFSLPNWYELGIGYLYFAPILFAAILIGTRCALGVSSASVAATTIWYIAIADTPDLSAEGLSLTIRGAAYMSVAAAAGYYASRERRFHRELTELAGTDPLTGVANRRAFRAALDDAVAAGRGFTLLAADVDGLKHINDARGHSAGDDRIVALAEALRATLGPEAVIGRVGGDEFFAITTRWQNPLGLAAVRRYGSVGVSEFPGDGRTGAELIALADATLYEEKRHRAGRVAA
jgi:GGDEF domain-containing protein